MFPNSDLALLIYEFVRGQKNEALRRITFSQCRQAQGEKNLVLNKGWEGWTMTFGVGEHERVYNVHQPAQRLKTWCCEPHKVLLFLIPSSFFVLLSSFIVHLSLIFFPLLSLFFLLSSPHLHFSPAMTGKLS